jgi:putative endonuclease
MKTPCVYLLASERNGTLYAGVTSDLIGRVWQHRNKAVQSFASRYSVQRLVWFEPHETILEAIAREKSIKHWRRAWKIEMIERENPDWADFYPGLLRQLGSPLSRG